MAFTSRSLEGVRRVTPESSKYLRIAEDLKDKGFTSAANKMASTAANIKASESPVDTPMQREARESAQRAISMGKQLAIQGDFDPADVVAPLKSRFFNAAQSLPSHQQTALLNRFAPEFRKQSILNQQEQKSFLELKEAQRKSRLNQAADALQVPVSNRLEQILNSSDTDQKKFSNIQSTMLQNPQALGSPIVAKLFQTSLSSVSDKLDAKRSKEAMDTQVRGNMLYQLARSGDVEGIKALQKGQEKGSSDLPLSLAKSIKGQADAKSRKALSESILSDLKSIDDPTTYAAVRSQLGAITDPSMKVRVALQDIQQSLKQRGIMQDREISSLSEFAALVSKVREQAEDFGDGEDKAKLEALLDLAKAIGIESEDLANLMGQELEDINSLEDLENILITATVKLKNKKAAVSEEVAMDSNYGG